MINFSDSQSRANIGDVAFGVLENNSIIYGVVRAIKDNKAGFGYGNNIKYTPTIYKHYPISHCDFIPHKPKQLQLTIF